MTIAGGFGKKKSEKVSKLFFSLSPVRQSDEKDEGEVGFAC